jgi:hypothetical protein
LFEHAMTAATTLPLSADVFVPQIRMRAHEFGHHLDAGGMLPHLDRNAF